MNYENEKSKIGFDWQFVKQCWKILYISFNTVQNFLLLILLLLVGVLKEFVAYRVGLIASQYYKVLPEKNYPGFIETTIMATIFIITMATLVASISFISGILYLQLRSSVTLRLQQLYFSKSNFYFINSFSAIDNPDQRITQDIDKMCKAFTTILPVLILTPFTIIFYTYKTAASAGWVGPVSAYVFFFVFTIITKFLVSWVSKSVYEQEKQEGNFRYQHMHLRTESEGVAFTDSGKLEYSKTSEIFDNLLSAQMSLYLRQYLLNFVTNVCDYFGSILTYVAVAFVVFGSSKSSAEITVFISQLSFFMMYLINKMTSFIDTAGKGAEIVGTSQRVAFLLEELEDINQYNGPSDVIASREGIGRSYIDVRYVGLPQMDGFQLDNITLKIPFTNAMLLTQELNLQIRFGQNLLISGPSGCGKSSLLRVLARLWPSLKTGKITRITTAPTARSHFMFLPQRAYFTSGTLIDQIILPRSSLLYPRPVSEVGLSVSESPSFPISVTDDSLVNLTNTDVTMRPMLGDNTEETRLNSETEVRLLELFHYFDLDGVLTREGGFTGSRRNNWSEVLSPGEQQRLSLIRLCYYCPDIAFLDEATSHISVEAEHKAYTRLSQLGVTVVTVAHRPSLRKFHEIELRFDQEGGWQLIPIVSEAPQII